MISPVFITIGSMEIYWYGVLIALSFFIGAALSLRIARDKQLDQDHVLNLIIYIIPASIIGARLYHVIFSWNQVHYDLLEIFAVRHGGLAIHGGIIGGVLAGYYYVRKHKLDFWALADIFAPSLVLGQAIGRWGNFLNQEAYGTSVSQEFISHFPEFIQRQMFINGQYHHPAFLYESVCNLLIFIFLMYKTKRSGFHGQIALLYIMLYSIARFFIEGIRTDSFIIADLRVAQVVSVILIALAVWQMIVRMRKQP